MLSGEASLSLVVHSWPHGQEPFSSRWVLASSVCVCGGGAGSTDQIVIQWMYILAIILSLLQCQTGAE